MFIIKTNKYVLGSDGNMKGELNNTVYCGCSVSKGQYYYNFGTGRSQSLTNTGNTSLNDTFINNWIVFNQKLSDI